MTTKSKKTFLGGKAVLINDNNKQNIWVGIDRKALKEINSRLKEQIGKIRIKNIKIQLEIELDTERKKDNKIKI